MSLSMTASALCTSFFMRAKRLWIAFAVPIVFDCVLDDNGAFKSALQAIAALVFRVVGFTMPGCCLLTACSFWRCVMAAGISAVVGDDAFDCVCCVILPGVDSCTL